MLSVVKALFSHVVCDRVATLLSNYILFEVRGLKSGDAANPGQIALSLLRYSLALRLSPKCNQLKAS